MKKYLIDTNICVFALRRKLDLETQFRIRGRKNCYLSEITLLELYYGAENGAHPAKANAVVKDFVSRLTVIPLFGIVNRFAKEKARLRKAGTPVHDDFDLLIGVTAAENGFILVTDNTKDFKRIHDLELENWMMRD